MPMLAFRVKLVSGNREGLREIGKNHRRDSRRLGGTATSGRLMTNSSPPRRATVSTSAAKR
jgi:hypothetical protein